MKINVTPNKTTCMIEAIGSVIVGKSILNDILTKTEIKLLTGLFKPWKKNEAVFINDFRRYKSDLYLCIESHTTQDNLTPDISTELWAIKY